MNIIRLLPLALVLTSCLEEPELAEHEQDMRNQPGETIEVHDCRPDWFKVGEVCVDPCPGCGGGGDGGGGDGGGGGGRERDPRGPGPGGGGGGGGGGGADPNPIPAPKDCTLEVTHDDCYDCCDWNADKVWGERCRRMPDRTKKQRRERALCWKDAEKRRSDCYLTCPRGPIITTRGLP